MAQAHERCEILIVGGGTGGVAAALAAARAGRQVVLLEETDWLGGQLSAQGVSALDEHEYIESFGGTASYMRLRGMLRDLYRGNAGAAGRKADFNPGACWVTRLAFEPRVAVEVIEQMLRPHVEAGRLVIHRRMKVVAATTHNDRITAVVAMGLQDARLIRFSPELVIDATELGDLLPLSGTEHVVGAETVAQTGEALAQPIEAKAHCVQSFTYTFACERRREGESHVIARPEKYEHYRDAQPYSLRIEVHGGEIYGEASGWLDYRLYDTMPGTKGGLWTYRRLLDSSLFGGTVEHDLSLFNWPGNDYRDRSILNGTAIEAARALQDAKRVSLGFLHWLQTEAPATETRRGAPELRLRADVMGSADGLCKFPYIRESRRIRAMKTIVEQEVSAAASTRAARRALCRFRGHWLVSDRHPPLRRRRCGRELPHQAVPDRAGCLVADARGQPDRRRQEHRHHAYHQRLLPAASGGMEHRRGGRRPGRIRAGRTGSPAGGAGKGRSAAALSAQAAARGVPLAWLVDVPVDDPAFVGSQLLFMREGLSASTDLRFEPDAPLSAQEWQRVGGTGEMPTNRGQAAAWMAAAANASD